MPTDAEIREAAEARVAFKKHVALYVVVNVFLAAVWFVTSSRSSFYWPLWAHLGWGFGIAWQAWCIYGSVGCDDAVKREEARIRARLEGR